MDRGRLPREADEIALQEELLKRMEVTPEIGSKVTIPFYDGNTETFTVSGIVKGGEYILPVAVKVISIHPAAIPQKVWNDIVTKIIL